MTALALVMTVCEMLQIREAPMGFFALPEVSQDLWLEYARDRFTGIYQQAPKKGVTAPASAAEIEAACIERMNHGPR